MHDISSGRAYSAGTYIAGDLEGGGGGGGGGGGRGGSFPCQENPIFFSHGV